MFTKHALSLRDAETIAAAARKAADDHGWRVTIAVVDEGGYLLYLQRHEECGALSCIAATEKGRTAALLKAPTKTYEDKILGGRTSLLSMSIVMPVEGGLPLTCGNEVVGGIGVSGVLSEQDAAVAAAGVAALTALLAK